MLNLCKPELFQKPLWHPGDGWLWRGKTILVMLFYLGLSKGRREEEAELPVDPMEGAHGKVDALQSIFSLSKCYPWELMVKA